MLKEQPAKKTALISVSDKKGLARFAKGLKKLGFSFVASGRNADYLEKHGVPATKTSKLTGWPPIMNPQGVKTIHPMIFGGILADVNNPDHIKDIKKYGIRPFQIVICNFYPFEKTIARKKFSHENAIKNIDIGGPAMVRCAAKNYKNVTVIVDPNDYKSILKELRSNGTTSLKTRETMALKAFNYTKKHDGAIIDYLSKKFNGK